MRLVEAGKLSLDEDVNHDLKSWTVPDNEFTHGRPVTLRALLSHTSGTGDGCGFPATHPSAERPTLVQILNGDKPSNIGRVFWGASAVHRVQIFGGGGTVIVQLLLADTLGKPFPEIMREQVLEPVGMKRSTYSSRCCRSATRPPRARTMGGAGRWTPNGTSIPSRRRPDCGRRRRTSRRWRSSCRRRCAASRRCCPVRLAQEMITPVGTGPYAVGFAIEKRNEGWYFGHGGSNWGFQCNLLAHRLKGYGFAVMTNSDSGGRLIPKSKPGSRPRTTGTRSTSRCPGSTSHGLGSRVSVSVSVLSFSVMCSRVLRNSEPLVRGVGRIADNGPPKPEPRTGNREQRTGNRKPEAESNRRDARSLPPLRHAVPARAFHRAGSRLIVNLALRRRTGWDIRADTITYSS